MEQLELNLGGPDKGLSRERGPWRYRLTPETLIEERDGGRHVFGLWTHLFGCWKVDAGTRCIEETIPAWPVLRSNGVWREAASISPGWREVSAEAVPSQQRFEADAAFAAYFSAIPLEVRALAAPCGVHQWAVMDMIWQVPRFARFLDDALFSGREQYVFACLALGDITCLSRARRKALAEAVITGKRHQLLSRLGGDEWSKAAVRALPKLGDRPWPADVYAGLLAVMKRRTGVRLLSHADRVAPTALHALLHLPEGTVTPGVLSILNQGSVGPHAFELMERVFSRLPEQRRAAAIKALGPVRTLADLDRWHANWKRRAALSGPFPGPPIPGDECLVPLADTASMAREARAMSNCLGDEQVADVLAGRTYFYHWAGDEPATVMVERDPEFGWCLAEALGAENRGLSYASRRDIEELVSARIGEARGCER